MPATRWTVEYQHDGRWYTYATENTGPEPELRTPESTAERCVAATATGTPVRIVMMVDRDELDASYCSMHDLFDCWVHAHPTDCECNGCNA